MPTAYEPRQQPTSQANSLHATPAAYEMRQQPISNVNSLQDAPTAYELCHLLLGFIVKAEYHWMENKKGSAVDMGGKILCE